MFATLIALAAATAQPQTAMTDDACARIDAKVTQSAKAEQDGIRRQLDWPNLCRYADENAKIPPAPRMVFIGDSITEFWKREQPAFFSSSVLDRGISGQTSEQILLRFYQDVVALRPAAVHILTGANDIAGNTGLITPEAWQNNIRTMVDLARARRIKVVLGSLLPADAFWWSPSMRPASQLAAMNAWLRDYAKSQGVLFIDYYAAMATPTGGMKRELTDDGVHPNKRGYDVMKSVADPTLRTLAE